jgi:integrase
MVRNIEDWLNSTNRAMMPVAVLKQTDALEFLNYIKNTLNLSNETYNGHLRLFKSFYEELIDAQVVTKNPFSGIKSLDKQNTPALYFTRPQINILKAEISQKDPYLWFFIGFVYYCFIRPGELRQLKVGDINFDERKILIRPEISKNKKAQYVSIPDNFFHALHFLNKFNSLYYIFGKNELPGPQMIGINTMKIRHQNFLKSLKFSNKHKLYSWKHTGAISCARAGIPLKDLQMQLRHHSLDQVNAYLSGMMAYESEAIKKNYPLL